MRDGEIVSLRTALRYLRRGDDRGKRQRLAVILASLYLFPAAAVAFTAWVCLMPHG